MNQNNETPLFPVAKLTIGPVPRLGIIVIRPDFLTNLSQTPEQCQPGRTYALTAEQARYLVQKIQQALHALETEHVKIDHKDLN